MIDDIDPSSGPRRSLEREQALRDTRQHIQRIEIETHLVKATLARLESDNEIQIAGELAHELPDGGVALLATEVADCASQHAPESFAPLPEAVVIDAPAEDAVHVDFSPVRQQPVQTVAAPPIVDDQPAPDGAETQSHRGRLARLSAMSSPWSVSLGLHAAMLAILAPMTYVALTHEESPLFVSTIEAETDAPQPGATPVELASFEDAVPSNSAGADGAALADSVAEEFALLDGEEIAPVDAAPAGEVAATIGQLNTLPTDVGTLMAGGGAGGPGGNGKGQALGRGHRGAAGDEARMGATNFFGTPARANRVVFLVDNSGSMKQGRMETTLFELARSVEALGEKQEFYVVFYSDQAYPMMYPNSVMEPLAATRENKQRLYQWLQTVELCTGGALLKAVEIADSLQPQVVYVLSDGDITGSVTMQRLTEPNDRKFAIHTLGMGVKKPQDAQNLAAIAQANRGSFQMVRPLPQAMQMAKARPIRSNPMGVAWGQRALQIAR